MDSYRKCAFVFGLLFVGLFLASTITHAYATQTYTTTHFDSTQMPGATVSPFPNNDANKHMGDASSGYLTGLPDNNPPPNVDPRANEPGSIGISF